MVINGLPESSDETIFSQICEEHMTTKPSLSHLGCRRLGSLLNPPDLHRRPRRLLLHLTIEACAQELSKAAKNFRHSTDQTARSVYINQDCDIVFGTETWLHSDIPNDLLEPHAQYTIVRKDRNSCKSGGGV